MEKSKIDELSTYEDLMWRAHYWGDGQAYPIERVRTVKPEIDPIFACEILSGYLW